MNAEQMNYRIKKFILGWGKELRPEDRAPAPLTRWICRLEDDINDIKRILKAYRGSASRPKLEVEQ